MTARLEPGVETQATRAVSTRAWLTVLVGATTFVLLAGGLIAGGNWIREHATESRTASARVISGNEALWRGSPEDEWQLLDAKAEIHEGDEISTELGTVVWVTLFDGSTLEVTERSHLAFDRLRASRFSRATKQVQINLIHGSVYATLAPPIENEYGELEIESEPGRAVASSTRSRRSATSPSFLVEFQGPSPDAAFRFRAAAFRGNLQVQVDGSDVNLVGPEQIVMRSGGELEQASTIASEMIANGEFTGSFAPWEQLYSAEGREPESNVGSTTIVDITAQDVSSALEIRRAPSAIWARTGVRQELEQTLRLPATLVLSFDVKLDHQGDPVGGRSTIPLALEIDYVDILGQERGWTAAYVIRNDDGVLGADTVSTVRAGEWTKVIIDLQNLEPIPRTLRTLVVYASGGGYESRLANLSLTVAEGNASP